MALLAAHKLGFRELIIAAALGGRLDQTLANLSLLLLPEIQDCQVRFEDGQEEIFLAHSSTQINGSPNDIVSLVPLWGAVTGVITQNLAFPLKNETLYPEHTRGISNTMTAASATVTTSSGDLLCIHIHPPKELK